MTTTRAVSAFLALAFVLAATSTLLLPATANGHGTTHDVNILNSAFTGHGITNKKMTIAVGDTLHFLNKDSFCHTVTRGTTTSASNCNDASGKTNETDFDKALEQNGQLNITFTTAGTVEVYCRPHSTAGQTLEIAVGGSTKPTPKPNPGFEGVVAVAAMIAGLVLITAHRRRMQG